MKSAELYELAMRLMVNEADPPRALERLMQAADGDEAALRGAAKWAAGSAAVGSANRFAIGAYIVLREAAETMEGERTSRSASRFGALWSAGGAALFAQELEADVDRLRSTSAGSTAQHTGRRRVRLRR